MPIGTVKKYFEEKGFGFIKPDDGTNDLFAPKRAFIGDEGQIKEGARVNFGSELEERTGKMKASWWSINAEANAAAQSAASLAGFGGAVVDPTAAASMATLAANPLGMAALGGIPGLGALGGYGAILGATGLDNRFSPYGAAAAANPLAGLGGLGMSTIPGLDSLAAATAASTAATAAVATSPAPAPVAAAPAALPPGWEQATDPGTGKAYYYNRGTGETSWTPPAGAAPAAAPAAVPTLPEMAALPQPAATPAPAAVTAATAPAATMPAATPAAAAAPAAPAAGALPPGWEQATDPSSGKTYYYNRGTGETSWTAPTGAAPAVAVS